MPKIKKLFTSKEDGFTLVELLAVIVILGIIVAIAIPAVGSVIDRADSEADDAEIALVEDAARLYVTTNQETIKWGTAGNINNKVIIPISEDSLGAAGSTSSLFKEGFLEDRAGETSLKGTVTVTRTPIAGESGGYTYDYEVVID